MVCEIEKQTKEDSCILVLACIRLFNDGSELKPSEPEIHPFLPLALSMTMMGRSDDHKW